MTTKERIALDNDLKKLIALFNPDKVSIYKLPIKQGCIYNLKICVRCPSYVVSGTEQPPRFVQEVTFFMDILPNYPKSKPRVYYGPESHPFHVNVFATGDHVQCTDRYDPQNSSLVELAEKTARAIVFDTHVRRFDSMASSIPAKWQMRMEKEGKLPTISPAILFARNIKRTPHAN